MFKLGLTSKTPGEILWIEKKLTPTNWLVGPKEITPTLNLLLSI